MENLGRSMPEFPPWNADADVKVDADAEDSALSISLVSHWRQRTGKIPAAPRRLDVDQGGPRRLSSTWIGDDYPGGCRNRGHHTAGYPMDRGMDFDFADRS